MDIFERDKLPVVATVEQVCPSIRRRANFFSHITQNCSTGLTAEGKTPKTLVEEMVPLLDSREVMYVPNPNIENPTPPHEFLTLVLRQQLQQSPYYRAIHPVPRRRPRRGPPATVPARAIDASGD
jgi:hypothetical protein